MYFKLDENLAHSSLNFLLELAMQLQKYIWISRVVEWVMHAKFDWQICTGYNIIYANYRVLLGWREVQMS